MPFVVTMPKLSPTMEEGVIAKWHKKEGDRIEAGELLLEVATDKATIEYNALDEGFLRKILVQEGDSARVNQPIVILTESKEESLEGYQVPEVKKEEPQLQETEIKMQKEEELHKPEGERVFQQQPRFIPEKPLTDIVFNSFLESTGKHIKASPLARKLAKEKNLDLSSVKGSGPGNRIVSADLENAQPLTNLRFRRNEIPEHKAGAYEEKKLTPMRKLIGQRLQESKSYIPHFYVQQDVDAESLVALRNQLIEVGIKLTLNDMMIKACALVLREHPEINIGFNSETQSIIYFKTIDISVAVSLPQGLITPIIRYADYKNMGEISTEIRMLAKKAKEGKLELHEYKGGSFTLSNLGMFGITGFQAIINPPQAAILAVGAIQERVVFKQGEIVPGKILSLSLSADHRVIDGVAASTFLRSLKKILENPASLLLE